LISYLVSNQTGVQGVYSDNAGSYGTVQEMAIYSVYGVPTISSGTNVTPFGFQGSYTDATGEIYLINRFYDPSTGQFLSVDPDVAQTNQPYVFTNDDPLNGTDPLGFCWPSSLCKAFDKVTHVADDSRHDVAGAADAVGGFVVQYKGAIALTLATGLLLAVTVGAASVMLPEIAAEATAITVAEASESAASSDAIGDFVMALAKVDPMSFVAMGSAIAAPAALAGISVVALVKTAVSESKPKKKK
jgi:RHS repeat-associated protein